jgi:hypothetical protein
MAVRPDGPTCFVLHVPFEYQNQNNLSHESAYREPNFMQISNLTSVFENVEGLLRLRRIKFAMRLVTA